MITQLIHNQDKKLSRKYPLELANEAIEEQTQKVPNLVFMGLAGVSIAGSLVMALKDKQKTDFANFVGHWAPTILMFGLYNKIVKLEAELLEKH